VQTLILESASPGLADAAERRSRIASDEQLAASIERDGLASFVEYWSTIPLFSSQQRLPESQQTEIRVQRLLNNPQGLANSLRGLGTGVQPSLWDRLVELKMPALIMAGELDHKFAGIAQRMEIPNRKVVIVPDAGHAVHLEQPATFDRIVVGFLEK
jgi:2-succinyl-6-hydroxy-2,4-cyclohexadiene-1-carboxylate synthase